MIDQHGKISDDVRMSNYFYEYARVLYKGENADKNELSYLRSKLKDYKNLQACEKLEKFYNTRKA